MFCFLGKFTVTVPGIYKVGLYVFAAVSGQGQGKLNLILKKPNESGETKQCAAHANTDSYRAASCGTLLQLEEGDVLYAKGHGSGYLQATSSMEAYLLYSVST